MKGFKMNEYIYFVITDDDDEDVFVFNSKQDLLEFLKDQLVYVDSQGVETYKIYKCQKDKYNKPSVDINVEVNG